MRKLIAYALLTVLTVGAASVTFVADAEAGSRSRWGSMF